MDLVCPHRLCQSELEGCFTLIDYLWVKRPSMKTKEADRSGSHIDVRFSRIIGILIILLSHAPLIFGLQQFIALRGEFFQDSNFIVPTIALLVGLVIIAAGLSHPRRWYLRLDRENKILMVSYGVGFRSRKYPYDLISYDDGKFHIETGGVNRSIGFLKLACNRKDLKSMSSVLNEPAYRCG